MHRLLGSQSPEAADRLMFFEHVMRSELNRVLADQQLQSFMDRDRAGTHSFLLDTDALEAIADAAEQQIERSGPSDRFLVTTIQRDEVFRMPPGRQRDRLAALLDRSQFVGPHGVAATLRQPHGPEEVTDAERAARRSDALIGIARSEKAIVVTSDDGLRERAQSLGIAAWSVDELIQHLER